MNDMRKAALVAIAFAATFTVSCSSALHHSPADDSSITMTSASQAAPAERALAIRATDSSLKWGACPPVFPAGCEVTVLWGDPGAGRSDVFLRAPANYVFPAHSHTSPEHMTLVSGQLRVRYAGQAAAVLESGTYAYGPAKLPHDAHCTSPNGCVLFISFESPVDAIAHSGSLDRQPAYQ